MAEPDTLRAALSAALGEFIELEVVLDEELHADAGHEIAGELMERLGISPGDLVSGAYVDLLDRRK